MLAAAIDPADVRPVAPEALLLATRHLVDSGRGLAMLKGLSERELREVDAAVWDDLAGDPAERVATLLRLRCLIRVFGARRLANLFLQRGHTQWGFSPLKFEHALQDLLAQAGEPADRAVPPMAA